MGKNIYVGNLPWRFSDDDLLELFSQHGNVRRAQVIMDRETGRSRGFGFVEMDDDSEAEAAIEALNNFDCDGRPLTVNEARQREDRGGGGGGGGGRGFGGGGNRGFGGGGNPYSGGTNRGRNY
ncbi:MAG: RNA recognition motif domain-containing protein [Gemmataceae bacterium]